MPCSDRHGLARLLGAADGAEFLAEHHERHHLVRRRPDDGRLAEILPLAAADA